MLMIFLKYSLKNLPPSVKKHTSKFHLRVNLLQDGTKYAMLLQGTRENRTEMSTVMGVFK